MRTTRMITACLAGLFAIFATGIALGTTATASGLQMTDAHARKIIAADVQITHEDFAAIIAALSDSGCQVATLDALKLLPLTGQRASADPFDGTPMQVADSTATIDGNTATGDGSASKHFAEIMSPGGIGRLPAEIDVI